MSVEDKFLNKSRFSKLIEATVAEKTIGYMEAILFVWSDNNI